MKSKYATVMFVTHARAKFRKLVVAHSFLWGAVGLAAVSLILSSFFAIQYFTSITNSRELTRLKQENRDLQVANEEFSKSVDTLRSQLKSVEEKTRKLAIIAGVNAVDEGSTGGVGGLRDASAPASAYSDEIDTMRFRSRRLASELSLLEDKLTERSQMLSSTPSIAPVHGVLTDGFGGRSDPFTGEKGLHTAVDISSAPRNHTGLAFINGKEAITSGPIAAITKCTLEREQFLFKMKPKVRHGGSSTFPEPGLSVSS